MNKSRKLIERFHYLGWRVPCGAHLRYVVESGDGQILACLLWTSPAWKIAARDEWIGWNRQQCARNLHTSSTMHGSSFCLQFMFMDRLHDPGVGSTAYSRLAAALRIYTAALETLVDAGRFRGTCDRAVD